MIGSAIKKFAQEQNFTCEKGIAYGEFHGYFLSLQDGSGVKYATFTAHCDSSDRQEQLAGWLTNKEMFDQYRLQRSEVTSNTVRLTFTDTVGTMPKMIAGLEAIAVRMTELQFHGTKVCTQCGQPHIEPYTKVLLNGAVYAVHRPCAQHWIASRANDVADNARKGSILAGLGGALLGGIVGAIPWGVAYYFNWFVALLGLLIGFCTMKGYDLAHGKQSYAKIVIVAIVAALCVVVAQFVALIISVHQELLVYADSSSKLSIFDSAQFTFALFAEESDVTFAVVKDILMGWFFAALGILPSLLRIRRETKAINSRPMILEPTK